MTKKSWIKIGLLVGSLLLMTLVGQQQKGEVLIRGETVTTASEEQPQTTSTNGERLAEPSNVTLVGTFSELVQAMLNNTTEKIALTADLTQGSQSLNTTNFGGKNLEIDGRGHSIQFVGTELMAFNFRRSSQNNLTFKVKNITLSKSRAANATGNSRSMFDFDIRGSQEYRNIIFENVKVPKGSKTPLVKANNANSVVSVKGQNEFHNDDPYVFTQRNTPKNPFFNAQKLFFDQTKIVTDLFTDFIYQGNAASTLNFTNSTVSHFTDGGRFIYSLGKVLNLEHTKIESTNMWKAEGYQREADIYMESADVKVTLKDSDLTLNSGHTAVLQIAGERPVFEINNSIFNLDFDESDYDRFGTNAAIRFFNQGATFKITNKSDVNFRKRENQGLAGGSSTIRMIGGGNFFEVSGGSHLGIVNGGGTEETRENFNQALEFGAPTSNDSNKFIISDSESMVDIVSKNGAAVTSVRNLELELSNRATFIADGNSAKDTTGIFNINGAFNMKINDPLYFDFVNRRSNGPVIKVGQASQLASAKSGLTWWEKGTNVEGSPSYDFQLFDYMLTGNDLQTISYSEIPVFNSSIYRGQQHISRMSSNNGHPELAYLRVPTNADKKIYGQGIVSVGPTAYRNAFSNEVKSIMTYNGQPLKREPLTKDNVSQWGEPRTDGVFMYELDDFAKAGDVYNVTQLQRGSYNNAGANIGSGNVIINDITEEPVTVIDVTPPIPAIIDDVYNTMLMITGQSDEPGSKVTGSVDGQKLTDEFGNDLTGEVDAEGNWRLLLNQTLPAGSVIQIFLSDKLGNTNPIKDTEFHDAVFKAGTQTTVLDNWANENELVKTVENLSRTDGKTYVGDLLEYTINVSNHKSQSPAAIFQKVQLIDDIPNLLKVAPESIKGINAKGEVISPEAIQFNKETNRLEVMLGDIPPNHSVQITFKTEVKRQGYDQIIRNTAKAKGQSSPTNFDEVEDSVEAPGGKIVVGPSLLKLSQTMNNLTAVDDLNLVGDRLEYRFKLSNDTAFPLGDLFLEDKLSEFFILDKSSIKVIGSQSSEVSYTFEKQFLRFDFGELFIDQQNDYEIVFQGNISAAGVNNSYENQGTVKGSTLDGREVAADSNRITTIIEAGGIGFSEVPAAINFGVKELSSKAETYLPKEDLSMTIQDARGVTANWELYVKVGQEMTLTSDPSSTLTGVLAFVTEAGRQIDINAKDELIYSQMGSERITETILTWDRHKLQGLIFNLKPGQATAGDYSGQLVWTLKDTAETVVPKPSEVVEK